MMEIDERIRVPYMLSYVYERPAQTNFYVYTFLHFFYRIMIILN